MTKIAIGVLDLLVLLFKYICVKMSIKIVYRYILLHALRPTYLRRMQVFLFV